MQEPASDEAPAQAGLRAASSPASLCNLLLCPFLLLELLPSGWLFKIPLQAILRHNRFATTPELLLQNLPGPQPPPSE